MSTVSLFQMTGMQCKLTHVQKACHRFVSVLIVQLRLRSACLIYVESILAVLQSHL